MNAIERTRRNHGLEHATIGLLLGRPEGRHIRAGYSIPGGFFLLGDVPTDAVATAAEEALHRMQSGEGELAISPYCGTNLVVGAALTTIGAALAVRGGGRGAQGWIRAFSNGVWAIALMRPLGRWVQRYVTTSADVDGLYVRRITRWVIGRLVVHWVATDMTA